MEYVLSYDESKTQLTVISTGPAQLDKSIQLILDATNSKHWGKQNRLLLDNRDCSLRELSADKAKEIGDFYIKNSTKIGATRIAVVAGSHHDYGIFRLWESYTRLRVQFRSKTFLNYAEAEQWLEKADHL